MTRKKLLMLLGSVCLALMLVVPVIAGCPAPAPTPTPEKIPLLFAAPPPEWSATARIITSSDLVNRLTNLDITVRSYGGSAASLTALIVGEATLASANDGTQLPAWGAWGAFEGKPRATNLRGVIVCTLYRDGMLATKESGIKTWADLKGKRVANYTTTFYPHLKPLLYGAGLDPEKDVKWVDIPGPTAPLMEELKMGRVDAGLTAVDVRSYTLDYAEAKGPLVLLPVEPEMYSRAREHFPQEMSPYLSGTPASLIQPGEMEHLVVETSSYVTCVAGVTSTRVDISEDIIYTYVKVFLENIEEIRTLHSSFEQFGRDVIMTPRFIPYHIGAIKALKEANMWSDVMEEQHNAALLTID